MNLRTDVKMKTTEKMKQNTSDSEASRKRKRANSLMEEEEASPKDFDPKELSKKHISQCISAIFRLTQEQLKDKNDLLETEVLPIFMQVTCVKISKVPRRQMRM